MRSGEHYASAAPQRSQRPENGKVRPFDRSVPPDSDPRAGIGFQIRKRGVYTRLVEENHEFNDDSYAALTAAAVAWQDAVFVLRQSRPVVRRHVGAVLNVAGRDRQGHWLAVALIELDTQRDDRYTVAGARYLDDAEIASIERMLKG